VTTHLTSRLRRLEGMARLRSPCAVCGGRGRNVVSYINQHDPVPTPKGCPECGEVMHVIVRFVAKPIGYLSGRKDDA